MTRLYLLSHLFMKSMMSFRPIKMVHLFRGCAVNTVGRRFRIPTTRPAFNNGEKCDERLTKLDTAFDKDTKKPFNSNSFKDCPVNCQATWSDWTCDYSIGGKNVRNSKIINTELNGGSCNERFYEDPDNPQRGKECAMDCDIKWSADYCDKSTGKLTRDGTITRFRNNSGACYLETLGYAQNQNGKDIKGNCDVNCEYDVVAVVDEYGSEVVVVVAVNAISIFNIFPFDLSCSVSSLLDLFPPVVVLTSGNETSFEDRCSFMPFPFLWISIFWLESSEDSEVVDSNIMSGLNFINFLRTAFTRADPKSIERQSRFQSFLRFWDLQG